MNKVYALIGLAIVIILTGVSFISAFNIDNRVNYNEEKQEVIIKNAFNFGSEIVRHTLLENTYNCGEDCMFRMKSNYSSPSLLYEDIRFINLKTGKKVDIKNYDFYIVEKYIENISEKGVNCDLLINGTNVCKQSGEEREVYVNKTRLIKYEGKMVSGEIEWICKGKKEKEESVDWQIQSGGRFITAWANWDADLYLSNNETMTSSVGWFTNGAATFNASGLYLGSESAWKTLPGLNNFSETWFVSTSYGSQYINRIMFKNDSIVIDMDHNNYNLRNGTSNNMSSSIYGAGGGTLYNIVQINNSLVEWWFDKNSFSNIDTSLPANKSLTNFGQAGEDEDQLKFYVHPSYGDANFKDVLVYNIQFEKRSSGTTLSFPENWYNTSSIEINLSANFTGNNYNNISSVKVLIYNSSNFLVYSNEESGGFGISYNKIWTANVSEEGDYNWSAYNYGDGGMNTSDGNRTFNVDLSSPNITNLSINQSGEIFGYPANFNISNNESDLHLQTCWYSLDYNDTKVIFNCNEQITINNVPEGDWEINVSSNDTFGWENSEYLGFSIDYYTHNITYIDGMDSTALNPTCEFLSENYTGYTHKLDTHATSERNVNCSLLGYGDFNFTLTESNKTSQQVSINPVMLNITFDATTNATITWLGGSINFNNISTIYMPLRNISGIGNIQVSFNENTQLYSFYNDGDTQINASLHLEDVDFDQPVKVLDSSQEVKDALVMFYKDGKLTYLAFTDINGLAHILVNDGTTYEIHVTKEGYDDYQELRYIPTSNTDTIIINLIDEEGITGDYYFAASCLSLVGIEQNCSWAVKSYKDANITFNWTWNGGNYTATSQDNEATLTLWVNSTTTPVNVTASVNPTKSYSVEWEGLGERSIQLVIDEDEVKDESNGILTLVYAIIFIIGVMVMIIVNRIPQMKGMGIYGFTIWIGIMAVSFPLLWFVAAVPVIYFIFKTFWGKEE